MRGNGGPKSAAPESPAPARPASFFSRAENALPAVLLCGMALLPLLEIAGRRLWRTGVPGSATLVQHGTLWIGFLGGALAAREGRLLALGQLVKLLPASLRSAANGIQAAVSAAVAALLCGAGVLLVRMEMDGGNALLPHVPLWVVETVIPAGYALIAARLVLRAVPSWKGRLAAAAGAGLLAAFVVSDLLLSTWVFGTALAVLLLSVLLGMPVFAMLGGVAILGFRHADVPLASIPVEIYRMTTSPTLPTLPLFAFAGYLLTAGTASRRLVRLFRALVGWMPGAIAVAAVLVCTFFTTFTGASGVTILALGGVLLPALLAERYPERFSLGLLTAAGASGLLFPPCLPVILYGVVAGIAVDKMFLGGLLPGVLMVTVLLAWAVRGGIVSGARVTPFSRKELKEAARGALWDILLPVVVLVGIFGGWATTVEAAALTVLYVALAEIFVHRDVRPVRDLPRVAADSATLIGGVLIVLASATGLSGYMIDAGVPQTLFGWIRATIHSKYAFLLILNGFLLVVGGLMDIFSAIAVVVPIVVPMAAAFDIHPVHLGIVFLANLQLGYLMPPVGIDLYLSAYRFGKPLGEVVRASFPPLLIQITGVLAITYLPFLSTVFLP